MLRNPDDVLAETVELDGADVLDVGCGAGELVRWLRDRGARPVGVECGDAMRARAVAADPDHADSYVDAVGQDLPFGDASFDVVVFSASLHHVPVEHIPTAVAEARRVLRPGGTLYVSEPPVQEPEDDVFHPVIDERVERTAAQRAIDTAEGFASIHRFEFEREAIVPDFDEYLGVVIDIESDRAERLEAHRDEIRAKFERIGERRDTGWAFRRTFLVAALTKPG